MGHMGTDLLLLPPPYEPPRSTGTQRLRDLAKIARDARDGRRPLGRVAEEIAAALEQAARDSESHR